MVQVPNPILPAEPQNFLVEVLTIGEIRRVLVTRPLQIVNLLPFGIKFECVRQIDGVATSGARLRIPAGESAATNFTQMKKNDKLKVRMSVIVPHVFPADEKDLFEDIMLDVTACHSELVGNGFGSSESW